MTPQEFYYKHRIKLQLGIKSALDNQKYRRYTTRGHCYACGEKLQVDEEGNTQTHRIAGGYSGVCRGSDRPSREHLNVVVLLLDLGEPT